MRLGIISDIHANLAALQTTLTWLHEQAVDQILCLGDLVNYYAEPAECIAVVAAAAPLATVAGNHDWGVLGRDPLFRFSADATATLQWTQRVLAAGTPPWEFLGALPGEVSQPLRYAEWPLALVHGSPADPRWGAVDNISAAAEAGRQMPAALLFVGHTHVPVVLHRLSPSDQRAQGGISTWEKWEIEDLPGGCDSAGRDSRHLAIQPDGAIILNPGSVGQPRDGDPRAACCIFDPDQSEIILARLPYPLARTCQVAAQRFAASGLDAATIARLCARLEAGR